MENPSYKCTFCNNTANLDNFVFYNPSQPFIEGYYIEDQTDNNYKFLKFMCNDCYSKRCFCCTEKHNVLDDVQLSYCNTYFTCVSFMYDKEVYDKTEPYNPYPYRIIKFLVTGEGVPFKAYKKLCSQKSKLCVKCRYVEQSNYTIEYVDKSNMELPKNPDIEDSRMSIYDDTDINDVWYELKNIHTNLNKVIDSSNNKNEQNNNILLRIIDDLYQHKINTQISIKTLQDENAQLKDKLEDLYSIINT